MNALALPVELRRKVLKQKKKKSRDLAKVVVLLERGIIFSSKIHEKVRNA